MRRKGQVSGTAALVITLIMSIIVAGVILTNTNTDAILSSSTGDVTNVTNIALVAFTILAIGIIAFVGRWIIGIFE